MSAGRFTYYHKIGGVTVAELDCRFEIERDGSFTTYLQDILTDQEVEPDEYLRPLIERFLQSEYGGLLEDARNDARVVYRPVHGMDAVE